MIATDLDGTLLRSDKTISEHTKSVLSRCRESGLKLVYATGRGGIDANIVPPELFDGRITMNGAVAKAGDAVVYNCPIPYRDARRLLVSCDKRGLRIVSQTSDMHYSNFATSDVWPRLTNYKIVDFSRHDADAEKIYTFDLTPEDISFIENQLPDNLYMVVMTDGLAMIVHKGATKSKAVSELASFWGIDKSEIVAFGDDLNDIDMISYAGVGVAMENALDEVKAAAGHVCSSNDHDGAVRWLEDNVL